MPRRVSHASTERILTRSMPAESMILTWSSVISEFAGHSTSPVYGSTMSSSTTRPRMRSPRRSMISPPSISGIISTPWRVPQSNSLMIVSCDTSTRRRVRYPEFAVLSAVSARPLRAPCGELPHLLLRAARAGVGHDEDRVERRRLLGRPGLGVLELVGRDLLHHVLGDRLGDLGPDVDDLVVALAVGDQALGVLLLDLGDLLLGVLEQDFLGRRDHHVVEADRDPRAGREGVPGGAQRIGEQHRGLLAGLAIHEVDQLGELLLAHHLVDRLERDLARADVAQQRAADGGRHQLGAVAVRLAHPELDRGLEVDLAVVVRHADLGDRAVDAARRLPAPGLLVLASGERPLARE